VLILLDRDLKGPRSPLASLAGDQQEFVWLEKLVKMSDPKLKNVFEAILKYGHDEDFAPSMERDFGSTQAPAGSREKLEVMAERVRMGQPLWHESDRADYSGLTGAVRPRD